MGPGLLRLSARAALLFFSSGAVAQEKVLFVEDDAYFVVWLYRADTGDLLRGFSLPREAMGNTLPRGQASLAFDGVDLYFTRTPAQHLWVLDPLTGLERRRLRKPWASVGGLAAAPGRLFATSSGERLGSFFELDPSSGLSLHSHALYAATAALTFNDATGSIFAGIGILELREMDVASGETISSVTPSVPLARLAYASPTLFALSPDGTIYQLDPRTGGATVSFRPVDAGGKPLGHCGALAAGSLAGPVKDPQLQVVPPGPPPDPAVTDPDCEVKVQEMVITAGERVDVPILLTAKSETRGFVVAALHDPASLVLDSVTFDGTATARGRADFATAEVLPNGGTASVVFDLDPPFEDTVLAPVENTVVALARYRCTNLDLETASVTEIRLADGVLGVPSKYNTVIGAEGPCQPPPAAGKITLQPLAPAPTIPEFSCGGPLGLDGLPSDLSARSGERVDLCLYYTFQEPQGRAVQGVAMGLAFDCRLNAIERLFNTPPESITAQVNADFVSFQADNDPDDGDGCEMILGILVDALPPFDRATLPATVKPLLLGCVKTEIGGGVSVGECLEVRFRDGVNGRGNVPIRNVAAFENQSVTARTHPCRICVTATGPSLYCGSGTLDGRGRPETPVGSPGDTVEVCFWYSSPGEQVFALTQAIRFNCRLLCAEDSFQPDPLLASAESVRFECDNDPADGDGCEMVIDVVAQSEGRTGTPLPPANELRKLGCVRFQIPPTLPRDACFPLEYHDGVNGRGTDLRSNRVTLAAGAVSPQVFDCKVCVPPIERPKFFCGGPNLGPNGLPEPINEVPRGGRTEFCFWYASPGTASTDGDGIQGLSIAQGFDCNLTCIESSFRVPSDSVTAQVSAEFVQFHCDNDPADGDGCEMVLGILVDAQPPFDGRTLPPANAPLKLACVDMEVKPQARLGVCLPIQFRDGVNGRGRVPVRNLVSIRSQSLSPDAFDCAICVKHLGPKFLCGSGELGRDGNPEVPSGQAGEPVEFCFWYCSPEENALGTGRFDQLQGLSMALTFDCRLRCVERSFRIPSNSITAALGAEFVSFHCDNDPADGDGCEMVLGILVDALPPFDGRTLPPTNTPLKLACVDAITPGDASCGQCFSVRFTDRVNGRGKVPTSNLVSVENESFPALTVDCQVCVGSVGRPVFRRGDCNFDSRVDISDPSELVSFLFLLGTWKAHPPCLDACDANDDGRVDLADPIATLAYLFRFDTPPPPPGPNAAGPDPTADKLGCDVNPCR